MSAPGPGVMAGRRLAFATVALAGFNLSLIHYVSLTEFPSLLGSNELVALLVLCAYFLGLSAGYLVSHRLSRRQLLALGGATLALHATLPFSSRWIAGSLWHMNRQGDLPLLIVLLVFFGITPLYGVFLPRLVDQLQSARGAPSRDGKTAGSLVPLYATEVAGSVLGLAVSVLLTPARMRFVLTLHLAGIAGLLVLSAWNHRRWLAPLLLPLPATYLAQFPRLDRASLEHFYQHRKGYHDVNLLASEFSPYQRVDIFEATRKRLPSTYLYLNGNLLYGGSRLNQHNLFVSILPNLVIPHGSRALVVAGGSLDAARYLAPRTASLDVCEIDEAVARLSRRYIQEPRGGFPTNWTLHIDDGKHLLGAWDGPPFDVISVDVPVPTYLQTAMLHAERFFALARTRLRPGGVFSISLSGKYDKEDPSDTSDGHLAQRVMAGLYRTFAHVLVVEGDGRAYAWASDSLLPVDAAAISARMRAFVQETGGRDTFGDPTVSVMDDTEARRRAEGFSPIGEADMQIVLRLSIHKLRDRFYE